MNAVAAQLAAGGVAPPSDSDSDEGDDGSDNDAAAGGEEATVAAPLRFGLSALFTPGQYVSCVVLRAREEPAAAAAAGGGGQTPKSALQVSLDPVLVNSGVAFESLSTKVRA